VCNYIYDEEKEGIKFNDLPSNWVCPVCGASKNAFIILTEKLVDQSREYRTVSEVLVDQIAAWGLRYIFGVPGTSTLGVIDAVRKNRKVKYIQVRHEQVAAFMASAYGKLTGNVSACLIPCSSRYQT